MNKSILYCLSLLFFNCSAQKKQIKPNDIKKVRVDTVLVEKIQKDSLMQLLYLNDYDFEDKTAGLKIVVNEKGLYEYQDSTLVNAITKIYLHKSFSNASKKGVSDYEKTPILNGFLKGKIVNGRKEGKWVKKIKVNEKDYVTVKVLNYNKGVLNGKYQVYDIKGNILCPFEPHPLYSNEYKDYVIFKNGSGIYYDYYYDTGLLSIEGSYIKNVKSGVWNYYDKKGNILFTEYYKNGILINQ